MNDCNVAVHVILHTPNLSREAFFIRQHGSTVSKRYQRDSRRTKVIFCQNNFNQFVSKLVLTFGCKRGWVCVCVSGCECENRCVGMCGRACKCGHGRFRLLDQAGGN